MDRKLAMSYYGEGVYDKAVIYFEKIHKEDESINVFEPYFKSLLALDDFKAAEKICKKQIKNDNENLTLQVYLGKVLSLQGETEKGEKVFESVIQEISKNTPHKEISKLATAFERENMLNYSLAVYQQANKYAATASMYNRNIAMIYGRQGKFELMISSLIDIIDEDPRYLVSIQSSLSSSIDFKDDLKKVEILKTELIKRSQANPNKTIHNEMLAWVYMLTENYNGAFIQLKAIDKKQYNEGALIQELGVTCINNEKYEDAVKCFDYVIDLGPSKPYYREAKIYKLSALKKKILENGNYTQEELLTLKGNYEASLENLGKTTYTLDLIRELAHLEGYFLNNPERAITLLEETKSIGGVNRKSASEIKVELGDFMVIADRIWDASLLFMQVEKELKEDKIGHLAKFKAAQVFYYAGDFDFAQGQLDVLKTSTSKLIANDAMELSMLITDNYNMDTTQITMRMYAAADLLIKQHKYEEAATTFDSIATMFTYHTLNDEILWKKSEMALAQQNTTDAIKYLEEIVKTYGTDILADNAVMKLAQIYDKQLNDPIKAKEYYKKILFDFKGSLFGVEARKRFREIGGNSNDKIIQSPTITP
jgi:tetratricopeptide (TPR) repeat protein